MIPNYENILKRTFNEWKFPDDYEFETTNELW